MFTSVHGRSGGGVDGRAENDCLVRRGGRLCHRRDRAGVAGALMRNVRSKVLSTHYRARNVMMPRCGS